MCCRVVFEYMKDKHYPGTDGGFIYVDEACIRDLSPWIHTVTQLFNSNRVKRCPECKLPWIWKHGADNILSSTADCSDGKSCCKIQEEMMSEGKYHLFFWYKVCMCPFGCGV